MTKIKLTTMQLLVACFLLCGLMIIQTPAAPGDLDPSFGSGGIVSPPYSPENSFSASAVAIQADGKIVTAGGAGYLNNDFVLARFNTDGSPDSTFGSGGKVFTAFNCGTYCGYTFVSAVVIQSDGKIVAAGGHSLSDSDGNSVLNYDFLLARYNTDGSLDSTFGTGGKVITTFSSANSGAGDLAIQPDGKIVAAGSSLLARYNTNGSLDTSFGSGGIVLPTFGSGVSASEVAIQSDGKIVTAGYSDGGFGLARYNTNGSLDTSFGTGGKVVTTFSTGVSSARAVAIQADGKIVAVGISAFNYSNHIFALARYNTDGSLDSTFGEGGKVVNVGGDVYAAAIQADGKIVAVGSTNYTDSGFITGRGFIVVRYNTDGSLDSTFGEGGKVVTRISDSAEASAVAIQSDGKIVVAGNTSSGIALARYLVNSVTPPAVPRRTRFDFDGDGRADVSVFRPTDGIWYIQPRNSGNFYGVQFGISTDKIVPADYDGDGKTDVAVYRNGTWYLNRSQLGFLGFAFGLPDDIPQPADFDGDGKAELAVWRPSNGMWYVFNLVNNQFTAFQFGNETDKPVVGDYDGDSKADYAVYRPSSGVWYYQRSTAGFGAFQFGLPTDKPIPADYDGDGKTDVAVFRPSDGTWYLQRSQLGFTRVQFGIATDLPTPADYDGDGKSDIAVFGDGNWYLQRSQAGFTGVGFGNATDKPVPNAFVP